jgi:hypothetical protein
MVSTPFHQSRPTAFASQEKDETERNLRYDSSTV